MFVYRVGYKDQINSIFKHGYSRQFLASNEGTDYGDGVYCNINISDSLDRLRHTPGGCIFKCELVGGLNRYLIFNERLAQEVYGSAYSIKDQVFQLFNEDAEKVWEDFSNIMKNNISARQHMHGRTAELLQVLLSPRHKHRLMTLVPTKDKRRNFRKEYEYLFKKHHINGVVYRGMKDGLCVAAYDFSKCIPVAYSLDGGRTFVEKKASVDTVDVQKHYGLKYKRVDYPITLNDGERDWEFSRVQKKNGLWNYLEIESGEEISPVDFDSVTLIDPETGDFDIEYNGNFYVACVQGFFLDEEEYQTGEGHEFSDLLELNKKQELNEITNLDEVSYLDYEIPSLEGLDSNNMISLYHVTKKHTVDNICKFGFDREFNNQNGNCYGEGVYTTIDIKYARELIGSHYGTSILQTKLIGGFDRFIIFDRNLARKYYGEKCSIIEQLRSFLSPVDADNVYDLCGNRVEAYSRIAIKYKIRGAIYPWSGVIAVLPYDFSSLIPYAVSYDMGKTFIKKANDATIDRFITSIDVKYRFGERFKKIWKAIAGYNENGERTGFAKVLTKNNKYNYIDIQTGELISPIDFDSVTLIDPETGDFEIEYNGLYHPACTQGFFWDEEDYMSGEGYGFEELPEIHREKTGMNESKTLFQNICETVLNEEQKLVDNFDLVKNMLSFKSDDDFYFVQITKRVKDNPNDDRTQGNYHARSWYLKGYRIRSVDELLKLKPEIIKICNDNNARAYITINSRSEQETNDFIKIYRKKFNPNDPRAIYANDIIPGQAKDGPAWVNKRPRLVLDIDISKDAKGADGKNIWDEVRYMLNMVNLTPIAEYETPSGGLHIILPDKNDKRFFYLKKLFKKFDNWQDKGRFSTVHPNVDGKIILYSNVITKGY